ncbi:MAG: twin-arginine translocation signal domain-containing protein, partial [Candidatus Accumulibacter sp.]|nr:twin-arginine translocation signal domain-containing protein [Accumulibacter sp.]
MNPRREFIKTTLAAGAAAVALPSLGLAAAATAENGAPDLITVKGENRAAMLDRALQAYGGIGAFVK